jgi:Spy/CpxP family protein refolding chaperone
MFGNSEVSQDLFYASTSSAGSADESCDVPLIEQLLPGHKIARGRGRRKQLERMNEAEKAAEKEAQRHKLRVSARDCRKRKKAVIQELRAKLQEFVQKYKRDSATIEGLHDEMRVLRETLAAARKGSPPPPQPVHNMRMVPQWVDPEPCTPPPAATAAIDTMVGMLPFDHVQGRSIVEARPYDTHTSVLTIGCASPAPAFFLAPLTPGLMMEDVGLQLVPGGSLPISEAYPLGGTAFDFECLDMEVALLL